MPEVKLKDDPQYLPPSNKSSVGDSRVRRTRVREAVRFLLIACVLWQCAAVLPSFNVLLRSNISTRDAQDIIGLQVDPADEFQDDIWPIRQPTPWDISTDFPYPRVLEFDTSEGTWMRLDVHPKTGEIIFDLLGDIYCLPSSSYQFQSSGHKVTSARPVLLGIPHDSDPHFSPDGNLLAFRSDAELGVENIWITEWKGCDSMNVRPTSDSTTVNSNRHLVEALARKEIEDNALASGLVEDKQRRRNRLLREGRSSARRVTNETYRFVSDPRFHPSGQKIVATKWYTSSRSLGAGEGWEYSLPATGEEIKVGSGRRVVGRSLPFGWSAPLYGSQQIGPEQHIWYGEDSLIFSKNTEDDRGAFLYSKDVHRGIYSVFMRNLTTGRTSLLVDSFPGGASRPELSRDGKTLAFVRRVLDKEALVLKDLHSGTVRHVWYGLTYDLGAISAPMGTYPSFAFTPDDNAIIIWAAGKIWHIPLTTNDIGEKIAGGEPNIVEFSAHIESRLAETRSSKTDLISIEAGDEQRLYAFKDLSISEDGTRIAFQGAGVTYFLDLEFTSSGMNKAKTAQKIPVLHPHQSHYSPSFVPGRRDLVIQARWSDSNFSTFELADLASNSVYEISGLGMGRYINPTLCSCNGDNRQIAFIKTGGDLLTGDVYATANVGLYIGELTLPGTSSPSRRKEIVVENIKYVPTTFNLQGLSTMRFLDGNRKLLVQLGGSALVVDLVQGPDAFGDYNTTTVADGFMAHELAINNATSEYIAFIDFFNVFIVNSKDAAEERLWSKPGNSTTGLARVSLDGGHDIRWDKEGGRLFWLLGPYLHSLEVSRLSKCSSEINSDGERFGIDCIKDLLDIQEVNVTYTTDISRLKQEARTSGAERGVGSQDAEVLAITNATILTMESGNQSHDLISDAVLLLRGGIIENVGLIKDVVIPQGAVVVNADGGYIVPGFIDVHAHWSGMGDTYPAKSWELQTFLAYGVTTLHNPSSDNVLGFVERGRVENGGMIGPRIFHTGDVIYGAQFPKLHNDVADMHDAFSALIRIKVEGGPASFSYKNYNQYSRASRQRLLLAARNLSMLCVPEGGMNQDWDLTYIIDGMTTIEHNLPIPTLFDDVLTLYALSGTGATPTHIVNYGGVHGEQFVWANYDVPNDPKLRRFTDHSILEALSESTSRPRNSYALYNTSSSIAKMVKKGLRAHIGAHGEPPLGLNYHAEMYFASQGGLNNYEVLRAATSDAALTLGIDSSVGSLSAGKLADFVVYPPEVNILDDDITLSKNIRFVARGGRLWNASTMVEEWPRKGAWSQMPQINAD